jgi:ribosomal RNA-processing protein 12
MVLTNKPEKAESQLVPSWLAIIAAGYTSYSNLDADSSLKALPGLLRHIFPFLQSENQSMQEAAGSTLVALAENCMNGDTSPEIQNEAHAAIAEFAMQGLTTRYQIAWKQVFRFIGAVFLSLRENADPLFLDTVKVIDSMRAKDGFEGKVEAEAVIGASITGVGPSSILKMIPLNLEHQG